MVRQSPTDTTQRAVSTRNAWIQIGTEVKLGKLQFADLEKAEQDVREMEDEIARLESELTHARNQRLDFRYNLWQIVKDARQAARVFYGEDSSEYELFGGTRLSERKRPVRTPQTAQG